MSKVLMVIGFGSLVFMGLMFYSPFSDPAERTMRTTWFPIQVLVVIPFLLLTLGVLLSEKAPKMVEGLAEREDRKR